MPSRATATRSCCCRAITEPVADLPETTVYRQADVADSAAVAAAVAAAEALHGPVECLVNNAGSADARPLEGIDESSYTREIDTNLKDVFVCTKAVLPGMTGRHSGTIVNISSISDRKTAPVALAYTATKHAVRAFSESLREAEAKNGVRVMNIAPAYIWTNIHAGMHISFDEYRARLGNPDFMTADQLADIVMFCWKQPPRSASAISSSPRHTRPSSFRSATHLDVETAARRRPLIR